MFPKTRSWGIFVSIAVWASYQRFEDTPPYWRTLKANGELSEKYPGGIEAQKDKLEKEGHTIILHTDNSVGRDNMYYTLLGAQRRGFIDDNIEIYNYSIAQNKYSDK